MSDAIGTRNIWECLGRLQSSAVEDPSKPGESPSRSNVNDEVGQTCENSVDIAYSQQIRMEGNDSSSSFITQTCKSKKRESVLLLASMQKKLKISHLHLQQKAPEDEVVGSSMEHECPLDLSTKSDDVISSVIEIPLDLSLKKELDSCTALQNNCNNGIHNEESTSLANCAAECGGLISISKQFPSLPFSPKKVSPVRPHIGGKPVVMDSNGNIPFNSFNGSDLSKVGYFYSSSTECSDRPTVPVSNKDLSSGHSSDLAQMRIKTCCGFPELPVGEHGDGVLTNSVQESEQQSLRSSFPHVPVIDRCDSELLCSSYSAAMPSCSLLGITTHVPDLVRSAMGLDSCSNIDSVSKFTTEHCLNVPIYKCQKKSKLFAKKTLKTPHNISNIQKPKTVPLAKVRPSRLMSPTATATTTEIVQISDALDSFKSVANLSSVEDGTKCKFPFALSEESSPKCESEQVLDSSGSPPVLSVLSPICKTSVTTSDNFLLSPPMPILSPRTQPYTLSPSDLCTAFAHRNTSTPIYSFGNSKTGIGRKYPEQDIKYISHAAHCGASVRIVSQNSLIPGSVLDHSGLQKKIIGSPSSLPEKIPKHELFVEAEDTFEELSANSNCSSRNSGGTNAFVVNSEFGKEVFKKSKLVFYASVAFDNEASSSENVRPYKDFILSTKYYKFMAPKFGFSFNTIKVMGEAVTSQQKTISKVVNETRSACKGQRGVRNSKFKTPDKSSVFSVTVKDVSFGRTRQQSGSKLVGRRGKCSQSDVKCLSSSNGSSSTDSPESKSVPVTRRTAQSARQKFLKEEPLLECESRDNPISHTTFSCTMSIGAPKDNVCEDSVAPKDVVCEDSFVPRDDICEDSHVISYSSVEDTVCNKKETDEFAVSDLACKDRNIEKHLIGKRLISKTSRASPIKKKANVLNNDLIVNQKLDKQIIKVEVPDSQQVLPAVEVNLPFKEKKQRKSHRLKSDDFAATILPPDLDKNEAMVNQSDGQELISKLTKTVNNVRSKRVRNDIDAKVSSPKKSVILSSGRVSNKIAVPKHNYAAKKLNSVTQKTKQAVVVEPIKRNAKPVSGRQSCSLLRELANSDGYVAEKGVPKRNDSLFIDSRFLSREERALQMALMRMTKMEVKEEWSKVKEKQECIKINNSSQKKRKFEDMNIEEEHSHETEKIYSTSSENNISRNKERKEMADKLKNKTSAEMLKKQKKVTKVMRVKKVKLNKALRFCKSINTNKHVKKKKKGSSWKNKSVGNRAKKCGRFRFRWKSGIWKKPKHSPSPNSKHSSLKAKLLTRKSVFQSLVVDVESFVSPLISLSPLSAGSSKLSPCFEKIPAKDDDVVSMSSSVTECGINRRTLPAEVKKLVTCHATGETVLHRAARLGYTDVALWCCQANYVDVNAKDFAGYTPLHETFLHSNVAIARYLIHHGADLNNAAERRGGSRPLHEAVECDSVIMVRMLLSAGADINLTNYSGKTVQDVTHTASMKEFLTAYLNDLNGGSEVEWNFRPSWDVSSDNDPAELGMDLLADVPCDEDLNCQSVLFESSEMLLLPAYKLKVHKEDMPRSYVLLWDILERLQMTKEQFQLEYPSVVLEKLPSDYLCAQFELMPSVSEQILSEIRTKCSEPFVDVFCLTSQLKELLKIVVSNMAFMHCCEDPIPEENGHSETDLKL